MNRECVCGVVDVGTEKYRVGKVVHRYEVRRLPDQCRVGAFFVIPGRGVFAQSSDLGLLRDIAKEAMRTGIAR